METIPQRLDAELKEALKSHNELKLSVVRMLKASLKNKEIEKMGPLSLRRSSLFCRLWQNNGETQ